MPNEVRLAPVFVDGLDGLKDHKAAALVSSRIERLGGPGYRVYFCRRGGVVYILLCGGTKRTQDQDISRAKKMAQEIGRDY
jgi:putative component of toxin-antitoxin plasmid stabilization module